MSRHNRYLQFLTALLPAGAFGLSVALASHVAKATPATEGDDPHVDNSPNTFSVATELQTIRDAMDEASTDMQGGTVGQVNDPNIRLAYWLNGNGRGWGNGGARWGNGGWPAWGNARPWSNGWGNGGWGNGVWHNGGWHNGGGGWHNWRN
jgi:hypothetical protein